MKKKYIRVIMKIIVAIIISLIPFVSINSSNFNINKNEYDKIVVDQTIHQS